MLEIVPPNRKKLSFSEKPTSYKERSKKMKEATEATEQQKEEDLKVAEKIIDELELAGIKCPRCGLKNVKQDKELSEKNGGIYLECTDCKYGWEER